MCFDIGVVTCGPNEALIISGVFYGNRPNMLVGGRAIVCPCIQMVQRIPLSTMTLIIESPRVYTSQGVPISVTGVAQVHRERKIMQDGGHWLPVSRLVNPISEARKVFAYMCHFHLAKQVFNIQIRILTQTMHSN